MNIQTATQTYQNDTEFAALANAKMQELLVRSATDMPFRAQLLADPVAAIAEFTGQDAAALAAFPPIKFVENTADATIVLPDFVDAEAELSEHELAAVAGGSEVLFTITLIVTALSAAYMTGRNDGRDDRCN